MGPSTLSNAKRKLIQARRLIDEALDIVKFLESGTMNSLERRQWLLENYAEEPKEKGARK